MPGSVLQSSDFSAYDDRGSRGCLRILGTRFLEATSAPQDQCPEGGCGGKIHETTHERFLSGILIILYIRGVDLDLFA